MYKAEITRSEKGKKNIENFKKWQRKRKWILGNSSKLNTLTSFESKLYICVGFESNGVISNRRFHGQDSSGKNYFISTVQIYEDSLGNRNDNFEK